MDNLTLEHREAVRRCRELIRDIMRDLGSPNYRETISWHQGKLEVHLDRAPYWYRHRVRLLSVCDPSSWADYYARDGLYDPPDVYYSSVAEYVYYSSVAECQAAASSI